jgi:hypothetical protein
MQSRKMKKILILILFLYTFDLIAQSNCVKGRILGVPSIFTMGIGYERIVNDKFSVQLLFNRYGYDLRDTDGGAEFTNSFVPEMRYYFGKKKKESLNKAAYLGLFTEISKTDILAGGEQYGERIFTSGNKKMINPGLLIGRNTEIAKRWFVELYIGFKYKFIVETRNYYVNYQTKVEEISYPHKAGIKLGFNIGYRL